MTTRWVKWCALVVFAGLIAAGLAAEVPQAPAPKPDSLPEMNSFLEKRQYAEALKLADQVLAGNGADLDASLVKVRALRGLGQFAEAARLALTLSGQHPDRPEFRVEAGKCAFAMGMVPQAIQTWAGLYANPEWASKAYVLSGQALLSLPVKCYGIVGRNVLDQFRIYFDYSANQVAFQPYDKKIGG